MKCVICGRWIWFWNKKRRYWKMPRWLNPLNIEEGWCHEECEIVHLQWLAERYLRVVLKEDHYWYEEGGDWKGMDIDQYGYQYAIQRRLLNKFTNEEVNMIIRHEIEKRNRVGDKYG